MSAAWQLRAALTELVLDGARLLDERRFGEWFDRTSADFHYRIEAYSPELRKNMVWLEHDRAGMIALVELLPKHHVDGADLLRHVSVGHIETEGPNAASANSALAIFSTARDAGDAHVDGGSSSVFLVGRYQDRFRLEDERWRLSERIVKVQTRQLGIGSHLFP